MKQTLKLLSIILFLILSSCQEEDLSEVQSNNSKVREISFQNARENAQVDNMLSRVFEGVRLHKNQNKNTSPIEDNDFTIDETENVKVISKGNSTTYTILIKRAVENNEYFENLVIQIFANNEPKAFIFKYIPTEEPHFNYEHEEYSFKGDFEITEIVYNASVFQSLYNISGCGLIELCDFGGDTHNAGDNCANTYTIIGNCDSGGGNGGETPPYTAPVNSGGGGGGNNSTVSANVRKMNGFITGLAWGKRQVFDGFPTSSKDAIFNYFVANNFANGTPAKVNSFLQSIITNNATNYFPSEINLTEMTPEREANILNMVNFLIHNNFLPQSISFVSEMMNADDNNIEIDTEKDIVYSINKPCQKGIVKNVMDSCSPFTQLINQTFNSTATANIVFSNNSNNPQASAMTSPNFIGSAQNFTIKIAFDNSYLDNATDLSIAATTLHELVHAYLMNLYITNQLVATNSNYSTLLTAFITFYNNQVQDTFDPLDNEMHNAMKDFIDKMANSLYNYANANNIPNVTPDYCTKLIWGSMYGTELFNTVLTPQQQQDYGNIAATEQDHLAGAKGTKCP